MTGNPIEPEPAASQGYTIERSYYKLDGTQVDPAQVRQNDRLVVVAQGHGGGGAGRRACCSSTACRPASRSTTRSSSTATRLAALAWLETRGRAGPHRVPRRPLRRGVRPRRPTRPRSSPSPTWCARSRPGRYVHPPATVEDMYRPERFGRTAFGTRRGHGRAAVSAHDDARSESAHGEARAFASLLARRRSFASGWRSPARSAPAPSASSTASARSTCRPPRSARPWCSIATAGCCGPSRRRTGAGGCRSRRRDVDPRYLAMLKAYEDAPLRPSSRRRSAGAAARRRAAPRATAAWSSGGSTLTMQVARLLEPREERTLAAKLRQIVRAVQLERRLSKAEILDPLPHARALRRQSRGRARGDARLFRQGAEAPVLRRGGAARRAAAVAGDAPARPLRRRPRGAPATGCSTGRVAPRRPDRRRSRGRQGAKPVPTARRPFPMLAAHAAEAAVAAAPDAQGPSPHDRRAGCRRAWRRWRASASSALDAAALRRDPGHRQRHGEVRAHVGSAGYLRARARRRDRHDGGAALAGLGAEAVHLRARLRERPRPSRDPRSTTGRRASAPTRRRISTSPSRARVTARRALQLSLNVPAVELLAEVGPARFLARLRQAGADDRAARRRRRPGSPSGSAGSASRLPT